MATDPAWFYSTLAQSSAAIVGLIGAILGTRILHHLQQLAEARHLLIKALAEVQRERSIRRKQTSYLLARWTHARMQASPESADATGMCTVHRPIGWIGQAIKDTPRVVRPFDFCWEADEVLATLSKFDELYAETIGKIDTGEVRSLAGRLKEAAASPSVSDPASHDADALHLLQLSEQIDKYRAGLIPQSFGFVLGVLGWLTATGVVFPLVFLPAFHDGWSKAALLIAFAAGLVGLLLAFRVQLTQLSGMGDLRWLDSREYEQ